ncbi:hypothetical protein [Rhodococcus sp. 66b]|uniref:hypothetical protein n=1 Tax=Rhodococcus sp. 66b TaxID=1945511 RepID=UPI0009D152AE|nr:hypothetical protein [Rhodococcus sp. 66b]OQM82058.1 hypothetical protein B0E55_01683 [Rhodococcus sp. 66b]
MSYVILEFSKGAKTADGVHGPFQRRGDAEEEIDALRDQEFHLRTGFTYSLARIFGVRE